MKYIIEHKDFFDNIENSDIEEYDLYSISITDGELLNTMYNLKYIKVNEQNIDSFMLFLHRYNFKWVSNREINKDGFNSKRLIYDSFYIKLRYNYKISIQVHKIDTIEYIEYI